jgi:hypothetical protein
MKEDHMKNRALKPGYNVQIGTENQLIVGFSIHRTSTDSSTLVPHMRQLKQNLGKLPPNWIADAGCGSEENYLALLGEQITPYVKYNTFEKDRKKKRKETEKEKYNIRKFQYDEQTDAFVCLEGKRLFFEKCSQAKSATGFVSERRTYRCFDCDGCPAREVCTQSKDGRTLQFSLAYERLRKQAFDRLTSEVGKKLRSLRYIDVEAVFGLLKGNKKFRRFHLRGLAKVKVEWGLLSIAHNLAKVAA